MQLFAAIVNGLIVFTIFAKSSIIDVWHFFNPLVASPNIKQSLSETSQTLQTEIKKPSKIIQSLFIIFHNSAKI